MIEVTTSSKYNGQLRLALIRQRIKDMKEKFPVADWKYKLDFVKDWAHGSGYSNEEVAYHLEKAGL